MIGYLRERRRFKAAMKDLAQRQAEFLNDALLTEGLDSSLDDLLEPQIVTLITGKLVKSDAWFEVVRKWCQDWGLYEYQAQIVQIMRDAQDVVEEQYRAEGVIS